MIYPRDRLVSLLALRVEGAQEGTFRETPGKKAVLFMMHVFFSIMAGPARCQLIATQVLKTIQTIICPETTMCPTTFQWFY